MKPLRIKFFSQSFSLMLASSSKPKVFYSRMFKHKYTSYILKSYFKKSSWGLKKPTGLERKECRVLESTRPRMVVVKLPPCKRFKKCVVTIPHTKVLTGKLRINDRSNRFVKSHSYEYIKAVLEKMRLPRRKRMISVRVPKLTYTYETNAADAYTVMATRPKKG